MDPAVRCLRMGFSWYLRLPGANVALRMVWRAGQMGGSADERRRISLGIILKGGLT